MVYQSEKEETKKTRQLTEKISIISATKEGGSKEEDAKKALKFKDWKENEAKYPSQREWRLHHTHT